MERDVGAPVASLSRRQRGAAAASVMATVFLGAMGQTSLATAMPVIVADLGGFERYTWALTAYLVASTVATPIAGRLADIHGRKALFVVGLLILIVGSAPVGLVTTMMQLVVLRAIQGIGGGIIMSNSIVALADLFSPEERGKAQGLLGAVVFLATIAGPLLAGVIADRLSWHWILGFNVVVGVLVLLAILRTYPAGRPEVGDRGLDVAGMLTLALAVTPVMIALSLPGEGVAWVSPQVGGFLIFGLVMAAVFVRVESRAGSPVMPLAIYRMPTVRTAILLTIAGSFSLYATVLFAPLFLQAVQGMSATASGGVLGPLGGGVVLGAVAAGQLISRTGSRYRLHAVAGSLMMTAGMALLAGVGEETGFGAVSACIGLAGLGVGWVTSTVTVAVQNSVPFRIVGVATASLQFYRLVSGSLGLALLGVALSLRFLARLDAGLPDERRAGLSPEQLDALSDGPRILGDPEAMERLRVSLAEAGGIGIEQVVSALQSSVAGAVGDVFGLCAAVTALSVLAALFLRSGDEAERES